jgi:hypothetical protein
MYQKCPVCESKGFVPAGFYGYGTACPHCHGMRSTCTKCGASLPVGPCWHDADGGLLCDSCHEKRHGWQLACVQCMSPITDCMIVCRSCYEERVIKDKAVIQVKKQVQADTLKEVGEWLEKQRVSLGSYYSICKSALDALQSGRMPE